jgi:glycosyltransferase involved in cell wall biosynthesis
MRPAILTSLASRLGLTPRDVRMKTGTLIVEHPTEPAAPERADDVLTVLVVVEPGLDGVFRHVEGLVDYLLRQGSRVHLAFSSRRSGRAMLQLVERVRESGGDVMDLRVSNIPQPADAWALLRLSAMIRRVRPDVIHAHSSKAGALTRFAACLHRTPLCLYTPHAYYGMAKPAWLRVWFFNQVEKVLGRIGRTIAISPDEADFARRTLNVPGNRVEIIRNPVDTARFRPPSPAERRAARQRFGIPEDAVVLATIGRMCWQKDPETAYQAVAPLCAANPRLQFLHLGWGKWKDYLLALAQRLGCGSQVRILDYVDDPRSFYHAVDGIVISSRYEAGWPLVFLEALACDLPVMAATCPGMSDIGAAGLSHVWTFPPEDVAGCTASVRAWLAGREGPARDSNHRAYAVDRLSPESCYGAVLDLYQRGVRSRRRRT